MGILTEYIDRKLDWPGIQAERKKQLTRISELRKGRAIFTFASNLSKGGCPISIDFDDRIHIFDQIDNLEGDKIDIILETPGGFAEVVEDIVEYIRGKFSEVAIIIPGYAKSAGTIMAMAGDEILMEPASALGPIDAQMTRGEKRFSADAFLEGLDKIKDEVQKVKKLNLAYVPILQSISPGEIQACINAQNFSKELVTKWLSKYKFKFWEKHSTSGKKVTDSEKEMRASEIAEELCDHGKWLTHGRSVTIKHLTDMRLKVTDYSKNDELFDAIRRYYVLLKMSFDTANVFKIYETMSTQLYRFDISSATPVPQVEHDKAEIRLVCQKCKTELTLQANLKEGIELQKGNIPFPEDNICICPICNTRHDVNALRMQVESQTKKKIV